MRAAVIVPTYNEAENLPVLATRLLELPDALEVVCVDDGSPDGTGQLADSIAASDSRFHVIHRSGKRGYSAASKEGIAWCLANGYDVIATMDADLSHDPDVLPAMLAALEAGADLAIGSRYTSGGRIEVEWGWFRRAVSRAGSAYARTMIGTRVRDCTSGFRCYRASLLSRVAVAEIRSEGYSFLFELLDLMLAQGARVEEVPITYVDRRAGASKISRGIIAEALFRATAVGVRRVGRALR